MARDARRQRAPLRQAGGPPRAQDGPRHAGVSKTMSADVEAAPPALPTFAHPHIASSLALCFVASKPASGAPTELGMTPRLSAIIITRNEAKNIAACLESVAF